MTAPKKTAVVMPERIVMRPTASLVKYARNSRKHSPESVRQLADNIARFGWTQPVLVDGDRGVIAGHGRIEAAELLGLPEVPCIELRHLTNEQKRALVIWDNRSFELSEWSEPLLAQELADLSGVGIEATDLGFDAAEVDRLMETLGVDFGKTEGDPDAVPEAPVVPTSKLGDVWLLGKHRVMCGDSTDRAQVDRLMDGKKADMVFTDPPYGVAYTDALGRSIANDKLTDDALQSFLALAFANGVSFSMTDAPWYVWHSSRYQREFENALNACGVSVRQQIVWVKGQGVDDSARVMAPAIGRSHFRWLHEPCFYASKGSPFNAGDRTTTTVWTVTRPTTQTVHPTQKPIPLIEIALYNSSLDEGLVLDLFGGSGSTLIACEKTGREARLMELAPNYIDVIVRRWQDFTGQAATLDGDGRTFAEIAEVRRAAH